VRGNSDSLVKVMQEEGMNSDDTDPAAIEGVTESLNKQVDDKICVEIKDLVKEFNTNTGKKVAVDGLNLNMYSGQITALLGHNGAGKTTAISMLTGLTPPSAGTATIEGLDISTDMAAIRKNLGVCPQHDILFDMLTVEEHLQLFATFKGTSKADLKEEVEKIIQSVGLTEKRKSYSKTLSGGQKRKLSVGIAFIGIYIL
jgi:ATP-binding cassette subfamily A (ABC1) protein 3